MSAYKSWNGWTSSEVKRLGELVREKRTNIEIAGILNRSVSSVQSKALREFAGKRRLTGEQVDTLYARRMNGEMCKDMANEFNVQPDTLTIRFKKAGYPMVPRHSKIDVDAVIQARNNNVTWKDMPAHIGSKKSVMTIYRAVREHKKKSGS